MSGNSFWSSLTPRCVFTNLDTREAKVDSGLQTGVLERHEGCDHVRLCIGLRVRVASAPVCVFIANVFPFEAPKRGKGDQREG